MAMTSVYSLPGWAEKEVVLSRGQVGGCHETPEHGLLVQGDSISDDDRAAAGVCVIRWLGTAPWLNDQLSGAGRFLIRAQAMRFDAGEGK